MKTRRRKVSDGPLTITRRVTRSMTSMSRTENSEEPIPIDLIFEMLSRLPAKSIARCRCVSKLWGSIILRPDFTDLFLSRSYARPQLLFGCKDVNSSELFFFSSPQPQNPDVNSSPIVANCYKTFEGSYVIVTYVHGLVSLLDMKNRNVNEMIEPGVPVICNPSMGESLTLPKVKTNIERWVSAVRWVNVRSFLGYDPIDKQFKLLAATYIVEMRNWKLGMQNMVFKEHQILTLGTGNMSWRMIECCVPHYSPYEQEICINGVLYYMAVNKSSGKKMIVCFDVRSEKFSFIEISFSCGTLTNYNGKLGMLVSNGHRIVGERTRSIELWVLEDFEKQEWSEHIYVLPALWETVIGENSLSFVGLTRTNEIVFSTYYSTSPFYIYYYNIERNTILRVEIQGMEALEDNNVSVFLDHVEDVKLMQAF